MHLIFQDFVLPLLLENIDYMYHTPSNPPPPPPQDRFPHFGAYIIHLLSLYQNVEQLKTTSRIHR